MQLNNFQEGYNVQTYSKVMNSVLESHEVGLQEERLVEPDRFSIKSNNDRSTSLYGGLSQATDTLTSRDRRLTNMKEDLPQVRAKEITVKQLDRNVTHLRVSKELNRLNSPNNINGSNNGHSREAGGNSLAANALSPSSRPISPDISISPPASHKGGQQVFHDSAPVASLLAPGHLIPENTLSLINACIGRVLNAENHPNWSSRDDPYHNFFAAVALLIDPVHCSDSPLDHLIASVLKEIQISSGMLADSCVITPKQFWKISDLFCSVINSVSFDTRSYSAAIKAFNTLGQAITHRDPQSSLVLFTDFALYKLANTLIQNTRKRVGILKLLHAFSPTDSYSHVQCIKRLQATISDLSIFIHCLTILSTNETHLDALLIDLYLYYTSIALSMPSAKIRAGATMILQSLISATATPLPVIASNLPLLEKLIDFNENGGTIWWELQTNLISLCGKILKLKKNQEITHNVPKGRVPEGKSNYKQPNNKDIENNEAILQEASEICMRILFKILGEVSLSQVVLQWSAVCLAETIGYSEEFNALYFDVLNRITSQSDLSFLLGLELSIPHNSEELPTKSIGIPSSTGLPCLLTPVIDSWDPLVVASMVEATAIDECTDRLLLFDLQLLHSAILSQINISSRSNLDYALTGQWIDTFESCKRFIFVAFCDPTCAAHAVAIAALYLFHSKLKESILSESGFINIFKQLYGTDINVIYTDQVLACQYIFESFMRDTFASGSPYNAAINHSLIQFSKNTPTVFANNLNLQKILKDFSTQLR